jgi:NTP pyrophosphatase (non-canonical NTP hydrolase)
MNKYTKKQELELYKEALSTWGVSSQLMMAIEEMSELTKEICKYKRFQEKEHNYRESIKEEIADVLIMIEQLKYIFKYTNEDIDLVKQNKLNKLENYLIKEKKNGKCRSSKND